MTARTILLVALFAPAALVAAALLVVGAVAAVRMDEGEW